MKPVLRALAILILTGSVVACGPNPGRTSNPPPPASDVPDNGRGHAVVVRVVDGDTLVVNLGDVDTTVRLLNVDAPETKDPNKAVQCLGPEASAFLTRLLPAGTAVELEYDGEKLDRYGRTLAGVWSNAVLVNAEVARAGLGLPVQFNGQVKFLPPVEEAAAEAQRLKNGAYADDVSCALPARIDKALKAMASVKDPRAKTSDAYADTIAKLTLARESASEAADIAWSARRATGTAAWIFHDAVRDAQLARVKSGIRHADGRLDDLRSTMKTIKKKEAAQRKRQLKREADRRERAAERKLAASRAEAARARRERQAQQHRNESNNGSNSSGGSNPPGYTGPRCYAPGGKTWRPC